jgi:tetratricopeptide (TPR) repeat protein
MTEKLRVQQLFTALICGILLAACSRDPQIRKQNYYDTGIEFLKKGKVNEAKLQFLNALKIDPKFAEAANYLAEIQFRQRNYKDAYFLLQQAVHDKPDYLPARKGLGQIYRISGKLAEAQKEFEYILEHSPDDIDALLNLGALQVQQNKLSDAEGAFNRILEIQPNHVGALLALASLKKEAKDLPAAERYLKLAVEKNPRSVPVHLALIKFYITAGRMAETEPLFAQAFKWSNNNVQVLEAQLGYYEGLKKFPEAEAVAKRIQASQAGDSKYWGTLGEFYVRINDWAKAKTELERVLQQHKDDPPTLHKLIEVHLSLDGRKAAESLNEALLKKNPRDNYGHLFKGRFYLADGDIEQAMLEFNTIRKSQPDWAALHYWTAQAHLRSGELEQAKQALETALKYAPDYQTARQSLAELENRMGAVDEGLVNARRLVQSNPGDVAAMLAYSQSLILKQDYTQAGKVLKVVLERAPSTPEAHRQLGILYLAGKNLSAARKQFKEAWDLQPTSKPLLEGVLLGYVVEKQTDAAIDFLRKEIQARPGDALLYHELAQVYLWQKKRVEAVAALQKALSLSPANSDSTVLLADASAADKRPEQAIQLIAAAINGRPKDADLMIRAGMIFEKIQRWDEARNAYERALQIDSGNALAKNNLAWVLVEHGGNIDQALKLAQQAKEKLVDNLQVTNTIGWIYYKKGIYKTASNYLKECADKDQKNATFQYQLGMTYSKLGNREDARRALLNALTLDPKFPEAQSARAALAQL